MTHETDGSHGIKIQGTSSPICKYMPMTHEHSKRIARPMLREVSAEFVSYEITLVILANLIGAGIAW